MGPTGLNKQIHPTRYPTIGLYAYFVRAGEGGYKRWDDGEAEEPETETETGKKSGKKEKKEKKEKKKRKAEAAAESAAEAAAAEAAAAAPKPAAKRKRSESVDHNPQEAGDVAAAAAGAEFPWEKHIKAALKGAEGQAMCIRKLRKHVVGLAKAHPAAGRQKKKHLKKAFHGAVEAHGKLHLDEAAGVVAYNKGKKEKKTKGEAAEGKAKAKAAAPAPAVEEAAMSTKRSKKEKKKRKAKKQGKQL